VGSLVLLWSNALKMKKLNEYGPLWEGNLLLQYIQFRRQDEMLIQMILLYYK
jgi:hypothetical protein